MPYDFIILGGNGMQGRIVARDLLENGYSVFIADIQSSEDNKVLKHPKAGFSFVDVGDPEVTADVIKKSGANIVINCSLDNWNTTVYLVCLNLGVHVIDLGTWTQETKTQLEMNELFKKAGLTAITSCGAVPGVGNVMLRHAAKKLDTIETIEAGFSWDSNIKKFVIPFSMETILYEFTQPVPVRENGQVVIKFPMDTMTVRDYRTIGPQKSFLVEHAELHSFYHYYKHKGVKNVRFYAAFPDHALDTIINLIELGFTGRAVEIKGVTIEPEQFLTQLLRRIKHPSGYKEWENLWVEVSGTAGGEEKTILMECIVPPLDGWEEAGCNVDTGMPVSIIAQFIKTGLISERGSFAPEAIVPEKEFFSEMAKRGMTIFENGQAISSSQKALAKPASADYRSPATQ